jgi:Predicted thiol oxidoreductase
MKQLFLLGIVLTIVVFSCKKEETIVVSEYSDDSTLVDLAGNCSTGDQTSFAFSYQINGLSSDQSLMFFVGNSFFNQSWVQAPSSTTARDGLGPLFNARSCSACHFRDGRGAPQANSGLLFRLGTGADNSPDAIYGGQLQDFSHNAVTSEGNMEISYVEEIGYFGDGTSYSLRRPAYTVSGQSYGAMQGTTLISPRVGQQMIGLGLLELISEADILANADPNDADGDGISGVANYVTDVPSGNVLIGRFGWKANVGSIAHQIAAAFNGDIGITSSFFPNENYTVNQPSCAGLANGGTPEIDDDDLNAVILYSRSLAVPKRRNVTSSNVKYGAQFFKAIGCVSCHKMNYKTGFGGDIAPLKNQKITPFTDLLLHDMGPGLADNVPDHLASGSEWRTQPLWGLGLISLVNGHTYLLHDGRARSIEEAILWHGGEAEKSKEKYRKLPAQHRSFLLEYLRSL